jgi:acyl dehydratase
MTQWFEDVALDTPFPLGSHTFTEAEILEFGAGYDPQYFHTDPALARHSHFGGLIASGWHTAAIGQRKMVDALGAEAERLESAGKSAGVSGPSPGVNAIAFHQPVRPGDTLTYTLTVTSKRPSNSLPGWGILVNVIEASNQHGAPVYHAELVAFSKLRDYRPSLRLRLLQALTRLFGLGKLLANRK